MNDEDVRQMAWDILFKVLTWTDGNWEMAAKVLSKAMELPDEPSEHVEASVYPLLPS